MRITDGGNVGIGTTNPQARLHLYSSAAYGSANDQLILTGNMNAGSASNPAYMAGIRFLQDSSEFAYIRAIQTNPSASWDSRLSFWTMNGGAGAPIERMSINNYGNVGINTNDANGRLTVNGGVTGTPSWNNNTIEVRADSGSTAAIAFHRAGYSSSTIYSDDGSIAFAVNGEAMRIATSNNVGIGTTSPGAKLDVHGGIKATTIQLTSGAASGYVLTSDASGNGSWQAAAGGGGGGIHIPVEPVALRVYGLRLNGGGLNTSVVGANGMRLLPFLPKHNLRPRSFSINVISASAGSLLKILVFSNLAGSTYEKLFESTDLDCSTTGVKTATSTTFQFNAGETYWVGIIANQSGPTLSAYATTTLIPISEASVGGVANWLLASLSYTYSSVPTVVNSADFSPASAQAPAVFMTA
jgi:hypothetical protein